MVAKLKLSPSDPTQVVKQRRGEQRLRPLTIFIAINEQDLQTLLHFQAFAARQMAAGDSRWVQLVMRSGPKKATRSASKLL
jgi:hypothetical protein